MKKQFNKLIYFFNLLLIIIALCTNSCKKGNQTFIDEKTNAELIKDAKQGFDTQIAIDSNYAFLASHSKNSARYSLSKTPDWKNATIRKIHFGKAVVVPINFNKEIYLKTGDNYSEIKKLSYLIIYNDKGKGKVIEWVTLIPEIDTNDHLKKATFVGKVIIEDWAGNFKKGYYFNKEGKILSLFRNGTNNQTQQIQSSGIKLNAIICVSMPWYEHNYTIGHENEGYWFIGGYDIECYSTGTPFMNNYENVYSNEGLYGGLYGETFPNDYVIDTSGESNKTDVTNNVSNPCLKDVINQLNNSNDLSSLVTIILRNTFGVNDQINVTFSESNLNDPFTAAKTTGSRFNNMDIVFNNQLFNGQSQPDIPSKEYLTETAMHEVFHAYLYVNPTIRGQLSQHLFMAQNYINNEVTALRNIYPNLSKSDAEKLVIAGYGELQADNPNAFNQILNLYNYTAFDVQSTNSKYKSGLKGTKC